MKMLNAASYRSKTSMILWKNGVDMYNHFALYFGLERFDELIITYN